MANRVFGNGITVTLYEKKPVGQTGSASRVDRFNHIIWDEKPVQVSNVLVSPVSSTEQTDVVNMFGKQAIYVLSIPKGDAHEWEDSKIVFFGKAFHSFRASLQGIDDLIPGPWNKKVWVEINE